MSDNKRISTGRGGAGNVRASKSEDEPKKPANLPKLSGKIFTTGRGGAGNMMANIDPDTTRAAQDEINEETPFRGADIAPTTSRTVGRGGFGNNLRKIQTNQSYSQEHAKDDDGKNDICSKFSSLFS